MKKKLFACALCLAIVATCLMGLVACTDDVAYAASATTFSLPTGSRPNYDSLFTEDDVALLNKAVSGEASTDEMKEAAMVLYNTANKSRIGTNLSLVVQESNAGITMADIIMHAYNLRKGDSWYYQLATSVKPASDNPIANAMAAAAAAFAGYLKVAYTTGDGDYWFFAGKGIDYSCDCSLTTFPYADFAIQERDNAFSAPYTLEQFNDKVHVLSNSIHELCNVDFSADILSDDIAITLTDGIYTVDFAVDCDNAGSDWYRKAQEDMKEGGNAINSYLKYEANLEVWDNGYAKHFHTESERDAGTASGAPIDTYSYIWNEDEILALVSQDVKLGEDAELESVEDYLTFARTHEMVNTHKLNMLEIIGIVVGCVAGVVIIIVVVIEVLVKAGKLPKLAQKRADKKEKRALKKAEKANAKIDEGGVCATQSSEPIDAGFAVACDTDDTDDNQEK